MKLEASLKHFSPQGMHITDDAKSTSPNRLNGTDIMTGIGVTSSRARFGLAAFFGKAGISKTDEQLAVQALARYAIETAPKNVRKAAGKALGRCCLILAQFAFAEYSRSAETTGTCKACEGAGVTKSVEAVVKHPGIHKSDGEEIVAPIIRQEWVVRQCVACGGKGAINARCRCGGSGQVLDHGPVTGSPSAMRWWTSAGRGKSRPTKSFSEPRHIKKIPALFCILETKNLILSEVVV